MLVRGHNGTTGSLCVLSAASTTMASAGSSSAAAANSGRPRKYVSEEDAMEHKILYGEQKRQGSVQLNPPPAETTATVTTR